MGFYRARDAVGVPGLLSLARIPLAACFVFAVGNPGWACAILFLSGVTDVLDGWYARTFHQVSATGAALDPVTDKIFVTTVAVTLVVTHHISILEVALLSTREIGELPLVIWILISRRARRAITEQPMANAGGKIATALQFVAVGAALLDRNVVHILIEITAVVGVVAAIFYWTRALKSIRRAE